MLLCLTRLSRSSDLCNLDLRFRRYLPEGVTFQASSLSKQSKQDKPRAEFFLPCLSGHEKVVPSAHAEGVREENEDIPTERSPVQTIFEGHKTAQTCSTVYGGQMAQNSLRQSWHRHHSIFKAHSTRGACCSHSCSQCRGHHRGHFQGCRLEWRISLQEVLLQTYKGFPVWSNCVGQGKNATNYHS